jgi:hypothetical protein
MKKVKREFKNQEVVIVEINKVMESSSPLERGWGEV